MALTVTTSPGTVMGTKRVTSGTLALDSSYPTGGYTVTPRLFGLGVIDPGGLSFGQTTGLSLEYDASTGKVAVYQFGKREVPNGFDLSASTGVSWTAIGI